MFAELISEQFPIGVQFPVGRYMKYTFADDLRNALVDHRNSCKSGIIERGGTVSLRSRTCVKRNAVFGACFKVLSLRFLYQKGNLIRIKTGLDTYLIRIQTRTPLSRYPPYDYSNKLLNNLKSGQVRPRQGTEICNFGAPSPLEALHWIFCFSSSIYLCAI